MSSSSPEPTSNAKCLRCGLEDADLVKYFAVVRTTSIFDRKDPVCPHGPFCLRCAHRKEFNTLPQCECRALVAKWSPSLPPLPPEEVVKAPPPAASTKEPEKPSQTDTKATDTNTNWPELPEGVEWPTDEDPDYLQISAPAHATAAPSAKTSSQLPADGVLTRAVSVIDAIMTATTSSSARRPTSDTVNNGSAAPSHALPSARAATPASAGVAPAASARGAPSTGDPPPAGGAAPPQNSLANALRERGGVQRNRPAEPQPQDTAWAWGQTLLGRLATQFQQ